MPELKDLENKTLFILREAYAEFKRPAVLWSTGKDSSATLWLCRKAFFGKIPFPVIHIDTTYKFKQMYDFRERITKEWGLDLVVARNEDAIEQGVGPKDGKFECCTKLKTQALMKCLEQHGFDALILAIRRDEHGVRAKERYFCFPPNTLIYGEDIRPIQEIKIKDKVFTHEGILSEVLGISYRQYNGNLIEIIPCYGLPIRLTPNHPILTKKKNPSGKFIKYKLEGFDGKIYEGNLEITGRPGNAWVPASEIKKGDWIFIPKLSTKNEISELNIPDIIDLGDEVFKEEDYIHYKCAHSDFKGIPNKIELTSELLRTFGYYIAEGSSSSSANQISFVFSQNEDNLIIDLLKAMEKAFKVKGLIRSKNGGKEVLFSSKVLCLLFQKLFGIGARSKKLPPFFLNLSQERLQELIKGCWLGDGSYERFSTSSDKLAHQLRLAFLKLGILSSIKIKSAREPEQKVIRIVGLSKEKFEEIFSIKSKVNYVSKFNRAREVNEIPRIENKGPHPAIGGFWIKVKSVKSVPYTGPLYNLEIKGSGTYIAEGISVHNSPRDEDFRWNYKDQPLEMWDQYQSTTKEKTHMRIHPILHWRECMPEGHSVITNPQLKDISEVKAGEKVLSHDGESHKILKTFSRYYRGDLVEITPYNLLPIKVTDNHPIYAAKLRRCENNVYCAPTCYNLKKCMEMMNYNLTLILYENGETIESIANILGVDDATVWKWINNKHEIRYKTIDRPYFLNYEPNWIPAEKITEDHYILIPVPKEKKDLREVEVKGEINSRNYGRFLRLCGYYVAEGFIVRNRGQTISTGLSFGSREESLIKDADNCIRGVFGLKPKRHRIRNTVSLRFHSKEVADFFERNFGVGAENKRIPKFIFDLKPEKLRGFVRACMKGDGCKYNKMGEVTYNYTTVSKQLALQMFLLFAKLGVIPSISMRENNSVIEGKKYNTKPIYILSIKSSTAMDWIMKEKREVSEKTGSRGRGFFWKDFCWLPVRKVERKPFEGVVYNLEVDNANSYTSNLIAVHNCDVWDYVKQENIPVNPMYLAKEGRRYRSLGCEPCTSPTDSDAKTVDEIVEELKQTKIAERSGRAQDKEKAFTMQKLRALGYM